MERPNPYFSARKRWLPASEEARKEGYEGVELKPKTLRSLVAWDVSALARSEQDRLDSAYRNANPPIVTDGR